MQIIAWALGGAKMTSYLKRYYLNDHKLRQRALLEFHRALKTGRMIAFTGAMTTEAFGYGSWKDLEKRIVAAVRKEIEEHYPIGSTGKYLKIVDMLDELFENKDVSDSRVGFSILAEATDQADGASVKRVAEAIADIFKAGTPPTDFVNLPLDDFNRDYNIPYALFQVAGIRRMATLNYDLELERVAMFPASAKKGLKERKSVFLEFEEAHKRKDPNFRWEEGSGRIRRVLSGGFAVESDVLNRERVDRMIEFSVGTDDVEAHIMHLHGRVDNPESMAVSYRDYDKLYRRDDLHKAPFEFAKRILIGGNPILFVGLGMVENEVNRELEDFISNRPYNRVAPTFLLWNGKGFGMTKNQMKMKRLDMLHRLGVFTIFDDDLPDGNFKLMHDGEQPRDRPGNFAAKIKEKVDAAASWTDAVDAIVGYVSDVSKPATGRRAPKPNAWNDKQTREIDELIGSSSTWREAVSRVSEYARLKLRPERKSRAPSRPKLTSDKRIELFNLRSFFPELLKEARKTAEREEHVGGHWRSMASRIAPPALSEPPERPPVTTIWQTVRPHEPALPEDLQPLIKARADAAVKKIIATAKEADLICVIGASGIGKGGIARETVEAEDFLGIPFEHRLLVNGSYCFDSDSMLDGVARFFARVRGAQIFGDDPSKPYLGTPNKSRSQFFAEGGTLSSNDARPVLHDLVIINGMERFFGLRGQPLSAEFEELLRLASREAPPPMLTNRKVKWIFFGTERVHAFMRDEIKAKIIDLSEIPEFKKLYNDNVINVHMEYLLSLYRRKFQETPSIKIDDLAYARHNVYKQTQKSYNALSSSKISGDNQELRRSFYSLILSSHTLGDEKIFGRDAKFAFTVLRTLAFIGMPTEAGVLSHCPSIVKFPRDNGLVGKIPKVLEKLWEHGLVMRMEPFPAYNCVGPKHDRYVLHRSLLAELRFRFGIPLSEAKLSTAFNMSLYVAQPVDGSIPEPEIHDELGTLIDQLIGAYRDAPCEPVSVASIATEVDGLSAQDLGKMLTDAAEACRACVDDECSEGDEKLLRIHRLCSAEYAQCLRTALSVIRGYYSTASILTLDTNDRLIREDRDGILLEHAERLDRLIDAYGKATLARETMRAELSKKLDAFSKLYGEAEPFYADEMVWLHNERGVVRLTMGDLYEARTSFERALDINRRFVEIDDRAHNWRRIRLNQLTVDIEGGDIGLAERKIAELLDVTERREPRQAFREDKLVSAIAKGYRGWCWHLRGQREKARVDYDAALRVFSQLDEARAQAYFARLRVNVRDPKDDPEVRLKEVERAMAFAQSSRQLDVVRRILLIIADEYLFGDGTNDTRRREANRILNDTIRYSLQTDTHRVRCEAAISIARARFQTGDYEGAFRNAADAMTIATRYGLELRKITIRAVIAQIMAARGHPVTAEHLVRTSIKAASRIGFETAIDLAERVAREIPQVSSVTGSIDTSAKKQF